MFTHKKTEKSYKGPSDQFENYMKTDVETNTPKMMTGSDFAREVSKSKMRDDTKIIITSIICVTLIFITLIIRVTP